MPMDKVHDDCPLKDGELTVKLGVWPTNKSILTFQSLSNTKMK
jgi:hypothetical protein